MALTPTTLNTTLGSVMTAHLRNVREHMPIEQAYDGTRILSQMEIDRERALNGGGLIMTQVSALQDAKGDWYEGDDPINQDTSDEDTMAITQLRMISEPIRVTREDMLKARGDRELFNWLENKHRQGMQRLRKKLELALMAATQGAKAMTSFLLTMDPDGTPTATVDGIDRTTEDWWHNQEEQIGSISANYNLLETLSLKCQKGGESDWDYAFCDSRSFLWLKELARTFLQLNAGTAESTHGKRMADLGIPVIEFEGKPVFWSPRVPLRDFSATGLNLGGSASGGSMFFCKKSAFDLAVHPDEEFKILGPFDMENQSKHGLKWHIMWAGQFCWKEPSTCGVAWDITA